MRASALLTFAAVLLSSCGPKPSNVTRGEPSRGAAAISRYGCGSCHTIARLRNAHGLVGPPLSNLKDRLYVAGMLQNSPENLESWIRDPKSINEKTLMPNLGVTPQDAMDIAAFLYSQ